MQTTTLSIVRFLALVLTAIALVPAGAHLAELPRKIALERDAYLVVQQIYAGWAWFGIVQLAALAANLAHAFLLRRGGRPYGFALAAFLLVSVNLVVFFMWTFPVNQATNNWTAAPENWRELRAVWEYSHAANALLMLGALACAVVAVLTRGLRRN
jgi:hypothetical protein